MIQVKIIADSISLVGKRITTMQLKYPRFIHSEFMTHRVFSRNASSSRAIPVAKIIEQVRDDPAMPIHWGKNQPGMQAYSELSDIDKHMARSKWIEASKAARFIAGELNSLGVHKQVINRLLEPFQFIHVVVTATEWENFFELRNHPAAQPEIQELARLMECALDSSKPKLLNTDGWHLPYITEEELDYYKNTNTIFNAIKSSAARCARVSYIKHDGNKSSLEEDLELYNMLVTRPYTDKRGITYTDEDPIHASPIEHQAAPSSDKYSRSNNFIGWVQYRALVTNGIMK